MQSPPIFVKTHTEQKSSRIQQMNGTRQQDTPVPFTRYKQEDQKFKSLLGITQTFEFLSQSTVKKVKLKSKDLLN